MAEEGRVAEDHTREDVAELKGEMRQMNQRVGNIEQTLRQVQASIEQGNRWVIGLILGSWVTLALAVLGLYARG